MPKLPSFPPRLPAGAAAQAGVVTGEKVIAWGRGAVEGQPGFVLATDRALYFEQGQRRVAWSSIPKATWEEPLLTFAEADDRGRPGPPEVVVLDEPGELPAAVHDRVTASVVISQRIDVGGRGSALAVARRGSDDGVIRWSVVFDAGLDPSDPALRRAADDALAALRETLGI